MRVERGSWVSALGEGCLAGYFGEGKNAEEEVEVVVVGERPIGVLREVDLGGGELAGRPMMEGVFGGASPIGVGCLLEPEGS